MDKKRPHDKDPAPTNHAGNRLDALRGRVNLWLGEHAKFVSSGKNAQRAVGVG
jgi:hypothetical protein